MEIFRPDAAHIIPTEEQTALTERWVSVNLTNDIDIRIKADAPRSKIVVVILSTVVALILLVPPIWILAVSLMRWWNGTSNRNQSVVFAVVLLALVLIVIATAIFVVWNSRRRAVKTLTPYGVVARNGVVHLWTDLCKIEYVKITLWRPKAADNAITRAMFDGHIPVNCRLIFTDGFAVIPPLIHDQISILDLIQTIPVEQEWK